MLYDRRSFGRQVLDDGRPPSLALGLSQCVVDRPGDVVVEVVVHENRRHLVEHLGVGLEPEQLVGIGDVHLALVDLGAHRRRQLQ